MLAGIPIAGKNSKPHDYQQNVQKKQDLSKTWVSTVKQFEDFRRKKNKNKSLDHSKTPRGTHALKIEGSLVVIVLVIRSFPQDLRGCPEQKFLKIKATFQ